MQVQCGREIQNKSRVRGEAFSEHPYSLSDFSGSEVACLRRNLIPDSALGGHGLNVIHRTKPFEEYVTRMVKFGMNQKLFRIALRVAELRVQQLPKRVSGNDQRATATEFRLSR
jgi:hypothetical protein